MQISTVAEHATRPEPSWYADLIRQGKLRPDQRQSIAARLLGFFGERLNRQNGNGGLWSKFTSFARADSSPPSGLYLHGGVGRGKTFLMDEFFLHLPQRAKRRVHFHSFMRHFHMDMQALATSPSHRQADGLSILAQRIAAKYRVLCFDEFHVTDIADAMILARILRALLSLGVRLVMTSNYAPRALYADGLARHLFLPTIALIEDTCLVFDLGSDHDYRMQKLAASDLFFYPLNDTTEERMRAIYTQLACGTDLPSHLKISGRQIPAIARCSDAIWFDFAVLCEGAQGKGEYLKIAEKFNVVFLSNVPQLNASRLTEAARRFTWLVDILYDAKRTLVMGAAAPLAELYGKGKESSEGGESGRTLSRLLEMRSVDYARANHTSEKWRSGRDSNPRPPA